MDFSMNKVLFSSKGIGIVLQLRLYFNELEREQCPGEIVKNHKRKIPTEVGIIIMDGLVSTGK